MVGRSHLHSAAIYFGKSCFCALIASLYHRRSQGAFRHADLLRFLRWLWATFSLFDADKILMKMDTSRKKNIFEFLTFRGLNAPLLATKNTASLRIGATDFGRQKYSSLGRTGGLVGAVGFNG